MTSLGKGLHYEDQARIFLQRQGLLLVESNYRCRCGEIDLIMCDHDTICFIEVKFRKSMAFGGAAYALPRYKQQRIIKTAQYYLGANRRARDWSARFDALLIQQQPDGSKQIDWIKNAFYAD